MLVHVGTRGRGGGCGRGKRCELMFTLAARRSRECEVLSEIVNMDDDLLFLTESSYQKWEMLKIRIGVHELIKKENGMVNFIHYIVI